MQITSPPRTNIPEFDTWMEHLVSLLRMDIGEIRLGDDITGTYVSIDDEGNLTAVKMTASGLVTTEAGKIANLTRITDSDSPYTILATDEIIFGDTDAGAITANLPAGVEGTHYRVVNVGSSGNDITLDPNGTEELLGGGAGVASAITDGNNLDIFYNATEGWF